MAEPQDDSDKTHEPTAKKLLDARKKGEIARSADITMAGAYLGLWVGLSLFGAATILTFGSKISGFLRLQSAISLDSATIVQAALQGTTPFWAATGGAALIGAVLAVAGQRAFVFAPTKIAPKVSRISPWSNAKNKYGRRGLFEFAKSFAKLVIYAVIMAVFLSARLEDVLSLALQPPKQTVMAMGRLTVELLGLIVGVALAVGTVDYLWQRAEFLRQNRMSHKDLRDETKDAEGDPHMKGERRARAQEIAMNSMLADVSEADVVIVNPTHYAVALRWKAGQQSAPRCVAKGTDELATRIRARATEARVPIHSDPPTARALHATVQIGEEIDEALYAAVAVAIRYADAARSKARARGLP